MNNTQSGPTRVNVAELLADLETLAVQMGQNASRWPILTQQNGTSNPVLALTDASHRISRVYTIVYNPALYNGAIHVCLPMVTPLSLALSSYVKAFNAYNLRHANDPELDRARAAVMACIPADVYGVALV